MSEVVNLRNQRKKRRKAADEATAAARRAIYGQSKSKKALSSAEAALATRKLDGHKREADETPKPQRKDEDA